MSNKSGKKGTSSADTLSGTNRADTISGRGGNDIISGNDGNDKIFAGSGNDWIDGGNGADKIHGDKGDDTVYGGSGNDSIKGGRGDDLITGGAGADKLTGNSGNDHFIYLAASDSPAGSAWDRITDFTQGHDKIDLAAFGGDADLVWSADNVATEYGVWFTNSGKSTFVYADTDGDAVADLKIELDHTHGLNLTIDDFIGVSDAPPPPPPENIAPVAVADNVITGVYPGDTLVIPEWALLANDIDSDGDSLNIESVGNATASSTVNLLDGLVSLVDGDEDETNALSFDYVTTDGQASASATVNVTQDLDGTIDGTSGNDILVGPGFEGVTLVGNGGNDIMIGGNVADIFKFNFSPAGTSTDGFDTIVDFNFAEDKLEFNGLGAEFTLAQFTDLFVATEANVNGDAIMDTTLALADGTWEVTLLDVSGHTAADFHAASMFS